MTESQIDGGQGVERWSLSSSDYQDFGKEVLKKLSDKTADKHEAVSFLSQVALVVKDSAGDLEKVTGQVLTAGGGIRALVGLAAAGTGVIPIAATVLATGVAVALAARSVKKLVDNFKKNKTRLSVAYNKMGTDTETIAGQADFDARAHNILEYCRTHPNQAPGILQAIEIGQRNPRRVSSTVFKTPWQKMAYGLSIQAANFDSRAFDKISSLPAISIADISDALLAFVKKVRATIVMMESVSEKIDQIFLQVEEELNSSNSGSEIAALFGFALDQLNDSRNVLSQSARAIEDYNHQQMHS